MNLDNEELKVTKDEILCTGRRSYGKSNELNIVLKEYISKDSIRELLKDVNETLEYAKNNDLVDVIFFANGVKNSLEELLEED